MAISTTLRSPSAIAVGVFFVCITAFVLLEDCFRHDAPFTNKHLMTLAVLAGTVYFGHKFWSQLLAVRFGAALGCGILFGAGTATCVLMAAGRNAEVATTRALAADNANGTRVRAKLDRDEAKGRYAAALTAEEAECASGQGRKCEAKRATTVLRRNELDNAEHWLASQKPEQIAHADIRAAAELLARLPYMTASVSSIEASLQLLQPFMLSLFCEIAAIVGFSMGLGHGRREFPKPVMALAAPVTPVETVSKPKKTLKPLKQRRPGDFELVQSALARAGRPVTNDELAELLRVSKGEASKTITGLEGAVRRVRLGRHVAISL